MVFNNVMENFRRRACLGGGGHMSHTMDTVAYSSVITRETVCIALAIVKLKDLEEKAADVLTSFVMAHN